MDAFRTPLNRLENHFCESEVEYEIGAEVEPGGAEAIIYFLERGLKAYEEEIERWSKIGGDSLPPG